MATSAKDTAKLQVEVEARTDAAVAEFQRLQSSTKKYREEVEKADKAEEKSSRGRERQSQAAARFGQSIVGLGQATSKAGAAMKVFEGITATTKEGTFDLGRTIADVAFRFGPYGAAIGAATHLLITFMEGTSKAKQETAKFARELEDQRFAAEAAASAVRNKAFNDNTYAANVRNATEAMRQEIWATEDAIAAANGYGESTDELSIKLLRLKASALEAEAGVRNYGETLDTFNERQATLLEQAAEISRSADLAQITADAEADKRGATTVKVGGGSRSRSSAKQDDGGRDKSEEWKQDFRDKAAIQEYQSLMDARDEMRKSKEAQDELDFKNMDERFELIMQQRAEAAKAAEAERAAAHERELARIAEEQAAREEAVDSYMRGSEMIADGAASIATAYLTSGDLSAKGFRKAVGQFAAAESIRLAVVAIRETVLGIAAATNPFTAALAPGHFAAAGQAAAGAAVLGGMAAALGAGRGGGAGMSRSASGVSGGNFGPQVTERPQTTNSQADTVPVSESQMQSHAGAMRSSGGGSNGGNVTIGSIHVLGAIDETTARKIAKGIKGAQDSGGRMTG